MVERKVLRSNLRRFLAAATGVMIGPLSMLKEPNNPVYEPIILFEVRRVNPDMLSGVTKTEQASGPPRWAKSSMALPGADEGSPSCSTSKFARPNTTGIARGHRQGVARRTIGHAPNESRTP